MEIRAGSRLKSSVCQTEVIAVKAPGTKWISGVEGFHG